MKRSLRGIILAAAIAWAAPAGAQDASALIGSWNGTIEEDGDSYWIELDIDLDRNGGLVGNVAYEQPCSGVWTNPSRQGGGWHFDETITFGRDRCANLVSVTLSGNGDELQVSLRPVEFDGQAGGTLYRLSQDELDAAAEAATAAADAASDDAGYAFDSWGTCKGELHGLDAGEAGGEQWFVDGEPVQVAEGIFYKYGLPRIVGLNEVEAFANYNGAAVFVETGSDDDPELIYVLVGPAGDDDRDVCEFQAYQEK